MMIPRMIFYFFCVYFLSYNSKSQYLDYSQYYASPLSLNPALAGIGEYGRFGVNYRNQWPSISNGYQTFSSWMDYNFEGNNNNVGVILSRTQEGFASLNSNFIGFNFANEISINYNLFIRGGIQLSYTNKNISFDNLIFGDQLSEAGIINNISLESLNFQDRIGFLDLGIGILTYSNKFWVGTSIFNILEPNISFSDSDENISKLFTLHGGYSFILTNSDRGMKNTLILPSINYRRMKKFSQLDIGSNVYFNPLTIGFYYRGIPIKKFNQIISHESIIFLSGLQYDNFNVSYSYDHSISKLKNFSGGSHEISLLFRFNFLGKKLPPREVRILSCPVPNF